MKRILLFTALGLAALLFVAPGAFAFGIKDIVKMTDQQVPDDVIITKIENSSHVFHLSSDDIADLRDAGVSDKVIKAMLRTESRDDGYYDGYGYYPYRTYYYDPFWYPRSSFSLGLDFGHRYYGRSYYPRRYAPFSTGGSFGTTRTRTTVGTRSGWSGSGSHSSARTR